MIRIRFQQTVTTEYEAHIDLPDSVQQHLDNGSTLDTLDGDAAVDLYEVFTSLMTPEYEVDRRYDDTVITDTDLPGHRLTLPTLL